MSARGYPAASEPQEDEEVPGVCPKCGGEGFEFGGACATAGCGYERAMTDEERAEFDRLALASDYPGELTRRPVSTLPTGAAEKELSALTRAGRVLAMARRLEMTANDAKPVEKAQAIARIMASDGLSARGCGANSRNRTAVQ